jgi:hypothetical protein
VRIKVLREEQQAARLQHDRELVSSEQLADLMRAQVGAERHDARGAERQDAHVRFVARAVRVVQNACVTRENERKKKKIG